MRIAINGIELNVETAGLPLGPSVPALLLLHGFTGSIANWQPFIATWGSKYHVIMVDIIGHGKSDAPNDPERYAMDRAATDLISVLDHLGIARSHVLGYSMGGRLALATAVHYPERIRALILEGASPGLEDPLERGERRKRDEALAARIEQEGIAAFVQYWETIPLFASQHKLPSSIRTKMRLERLANREIGLAGSLRGMGTGVQPSLWHELKRVNLPVQLITGEEDHKFSHIAERMLERLPQAECHRVAGAGHTVHVEQAAIFDTIVMDFLKKIDSTT